MNDILFDHTIHIISTHTHHPTQLIRSIQSVTRAERGKARRARLPEKCSKIRHLIGAFGFKLFPGILSHGSMDHFFFPPPLPLLSFLSPVGYVGQTFFFPGCSLTVFVCWAGGFEDAQRSTRSGSAQVVATTNATVDRSAKGGNLEG